MKILDDFYDEIADAIREKLGVNDTFKSKLFPAKIRSIQTGSVEPVLTGFSIVTPPTDTLYTYNGFRTDNVDVTGIVLHADFNAVGVLFGVNFSPDLTEPIAMDTLNLGVSSDNAVCYAVTLTVSGDSVVTALTDTPAYVVFSPYSNLNDSITAITATFVYGNTKQKLSCQQTITVQYESPIWKDIDDANMTWSEFETRFQTWHDVENG